MQVLHVCSEMFPLLKTGGLADVIGALPAAQIADGVDARVLLPAFPDLHNHKIISLLFHNYNFAIAINHNVNIW